MNNKRARSDYHGALKSGMRSLLIRRAGPQGTEEAKEDGEDLSDVAVVSSLQDVVDWVKQVNRNPI